MGEGPSSPTTAGLLEPAFPGAWGCHPGMGLPQRTRNSENCTDLIILIPEMPDQSTGRTDHTDACIHKNGRSPQPWARAFPSGEGRWRMHKYHKTTRLGGVTGHEGTMLQRQSEALNTGPTRYISLHHTHNLYIKEGRPQYIYVQAAFVRENEQGTWSHAREGLACLLSVGLCPHLSHKVTWDHKMSQLASARSWEVLPSILGVGLWVSAGEEVPRAENTRTLRGITSLGVAWEGPRLGRRGGMSHWSGRGGRCSRLARQV